MASDKSSSKPPSNFSWVEPGVLAGSGCPANEDHYRYFCENGIRHVITLKEEYPRGSAENCDKYKLKRSKINIRDFCPPTLEQIKEFIKLIDEDEKNSQPAVVHCALGCGRTGTMLACYFVNRRNLSAQEAIQEIRTIRPHSIETMEQEKAVAEYSSYLMDNRK